MPPAIKYLAEKEIQYCYYLDLYQPIIEKDSHLINDYPQSVTDTLKNVLNNLNDQELFNNTIFYKRVIIAHVSTYDILGGSLMEGLDSNYLNNRLNYCRTKLTNQMQGYALAWFMSRLINSNQNSFFDLFYKNYNYNTSSSGTNKYVDSLKSLVSHSKMKPEEFLNFKFEDKSHVSNKLRDYINKDFVLIDFWATWCIPCREQVPYLESLAKRYKDKIQFISISADQFISKWDKWIKDSTGKQNNILQIHALNGFENQLLKQLMISSIPRYLFISKEGKIIEEDAPRPNNPKLAELFNLSLKD
jgi:thiol-disulfide isomerase/thioredoxin